MGRERWLITGASGQLGGHVHEELARRRPHDHVHALGFRSAARSRVSETLDLRSSRNVSALLERVRPTRILHFAGLSSPAAGEADPASAHALHVGATRLLAEHARRTGAWMLYASTDFVWGGAQGPHGEQADPSPLGIYGATKYAGEQVFAPFRCGLIARYSLLVGLPVDSRATTWTQLLERLERDEPVDAIADEWRTPLGLAEAARATIDLALGRHAGLVQIAGPARRTPHEIIDALRAAIGSDSPVRAIARSDFPSGWLRPADATQSCDRLHTLLPDFRPERDARDLWRADLRDRSRQLCVIVPVFRGSATLQRSLRSLEAQRFDTGRGSLRPDRVEVMLVVNDGLEESWTAAEREAERLTRRGFRARAIKSPPGRRAAFAAAERLCPRAADRLYLDQDARLSDGALAALSCALQRPDIRFAALSGRFEPSPSFLVRRFCTYWRSIPYCSASPVTMGAYAVSAEGRRRWDMLPDIISDDKYVRLLFEPHERLLLHSESYHVIPPSTWKDLVGARARYFGGNRQLRTFAGCRRDPVPRYRGVLGPLVKQGAIGDFAIFVITCLAAIVVQWARSLRRLSHRPGHSVEADRLEASPSWGTLRDHPEPALAEQS